VIRRQIDFLNFHYWCKRVCLDTGHGKEYKELWSSSSVGGELQPEPVLSEEMPNLIQELYHEFDGHGALPRYDAILVDEGQDFLPLWWQTLRLALKEGGEMVLVADKTQNIYSTAAAWTEDIMENAGFRGPWAELRISYRLPPTVVPLVSKFAKDFLSDEEIDIPHVEQRGHQVTLADLYPIELRWVHVRDHSNRLNVCVSELRRMMMQLSSDTAIPDITVLSGKKLGQTLTDFLENKGVHVLHTFAKDNLYSRRQ
jgi:hypothetical protein